ncbi:MAG: hypothetical protein QXG65_03820 [Thermoplasmata archaeon]
MADPVEQTDAPPRDPEPSLRPVSWDPPPAVIERLRPWINLSRAGPEEFYAWLMRLVPLLPEAKAPADPHPEDLGTRVRELAGALAESARAEAQAHFQASEYYQANVLLARRVRALEAMLRAAGIPFPAGSRSLEAAAERFLPREVPP